MSYLIFYVIFLVSISLAASAALLCDIFFFISLSHRRLKPNETKNLRIISGVSAASSIIGAVALVKLIAIRLASNTIPDQNMLVIVSLILVVAFACSLSMRNIHLPALKRHQHDYHHISDSFVHHQSSLLSTGAISIISWIFILTIIAADSRSIIVSINFWQIVVSYIIASYLFSKLALLTKKKIKG